MSPITLAGSDAVPLPDGQAPVFHDPLANMDLGGLDPTEAVMDVLRRPPGEGVMAMETRWRALGWLCLRHERTVSGELLAMRHELLADKFLRYDYAKALAQLCGDEGLQVLVSLAQDPDRETRKCAAIALRDSGCQARPTLAHLARDDPDEYVRHYAQMSLRALDQSARGAEGLPKGGAASSKQPRGAAGERPNESRTPVPQEWRPPDRRPRPPHPPTIPLQSSPGAAANPACLLPLAGVALAAIIAAIGTVALYRRLRR